MSKLMVSLFCVGTPTIKYIDIAYDVLCNKDKLYVVYIHTLTCERFRFVIKKFKYIIGIQQICGVVDGTHVPLSSYRPNMRITIAASDYYNRKQVLNIAM